MNPYEVLGVSPNVSDEELKKAYRNLAKKYHPDRYANSPLANSASEKMKQINEAYDTILEERKRQKSGGRQYDTYYTQNDNYQGGYSQFDDIRQLINENRLDEAEFDLSDFSDFPSTERNAEWYYLMGVVVYRKGFLEEAYNYFATACRLDPNNMEYRTFYDRVREQRRGDYYGGYDPRSTGFPSCGCCDICTCLMCSDCLCDCMNCH